MRQELLGAFGVLLASAGLAFAQPSPLDPTLPPPLVPAAARNSDRYQPTQEASAYPVFMWVNTDYLLWSIKGGRPLPPLVTTGPTTAAMPAVLTDPTTVVL